MRYSGHKAYKGYKARTLIQTALLSACMLSSVAYSQLQIVITQGVDNPVQIAIVPFAWDGFGVLEDDVPAVVTSNLRNSGEFAPIAEENMLSTPNEQEEVFARRTYIERSFGRRTISVA